MFRVRSARPSGYWILDIACCVLGIEYSVYTEASSHRKLVSIGFIIFLGSVSGVAKKEVRIGGGNGEFKAKREK